jgi:succinate-semialdehyde dehydrogenase
MPYKDMKGKCFMEKNYKMIINGELAGSGSGETVEVKNPSNSEVVATVPQGTKEDFERAVDAASNAFKEWAETPAVKRADIIKKAADIMISRADEIGKILTLEQGKPLGEGVGEIKAGASAFDFYSGEAIRVLGEIYPGSKPRQRCFTVKQPVGVVVAIAPWNYPIVLLAQKIAPALAAGCTVVAKPSSVTPLACIEMVKCCLEAGIPKGVLNLITVPGKILGEVLGGNPKVSKISFTGETSTGKKIMALAADSIKKVSLELGGHCPLIVLDDADIALSVKQGVYRSFRNMGQICNSINRIFVDKKIFDKYVEGFVKQTKKLKMGDGIENPKIDLGPMATESGRNKVIEHVKDALDKGAKVLTGGKIPEGKQYERGFFYEPTVLVNVTKDMKVMQEETFGPIAPIMSFETVEEAVELANNTQFGLVDYVFTKDLAKGFRLAEALEAGTVGINNVVGAEIPQPYCGWKESGLGVELSHHGIDEYLRLKHIRISF